MSECVSETVTGSPPAQKRVLLGMPGYAALTGGAALGFFASGNKRHVIRRLQESSLLAHNFNILWCEALNVAKADGLDFFAMQHSDVEPEQGWLDTLIDELEARDLDVLGVAVPIKDGRGLTSTALGRDDGNTWRVHGRLTTTDLYRLPETFTSEDVGRPLLLNTGLWVCRFGDWCKKVHFEINDRIVIDPDGDYIPQVEPEDWFFSRLLHELGLKIGCTRKVRVQHVGPAKFSNGYPWGQHKHDREYLTASPLDVPLGDDWFPGTAAGWLTETEGAELARLAKDKAVLEIGSYCGRSTICLARTAKCVTAVDTFDGRGTACEGDTLGTFLANLERFGVRDRVSVMRGESAAVLPDLPPVYDLVFVDGSHDYESVKRDAALATACLKPGGVLAFHDFGDRDPGVKQAVDELIAGGADLLGRADSLAVLRPGATKSVASPTLSLAGA